MKKTLSKILMGVIMLSFFLAPLSTVYAGVNGLTIQPVTPTDITPSKVTIHVQVDGQPDPNEVFKLTLKTTWSVLFTAPWTTLVDKNLSSQNVQIAVPYTYDPDTTYYITVFNENGTNTVISNTVTFKGNGSSINQNGGPVGTNPADPIQNKIAQDDPDYLVCWGGIYEGFIVKGCIASLFYIFWEVSAFLARAAGGFLDFFVYYSTNSDSYRSQFVEKGWAVVRDVSNIFFIIALLYVAIKTILNLNVSNNKKLIGTIVVIALLINFSLFVTKVIIDGTNILAKVFYNNITSVDKNGNSQPQAGGEKSISVGMISKYNPQKIISKEAYDADGGAYLFISVTVLLIGITLYTAYMFLAVALLFVGRVVSLWLSMIFAPLAFVSYTVPFDLGSVGHTQWWKDLFKSAFMAPIFIFFLYLIVLFLDIGNNITYTDSDQLFQKIMAVIIPFAVLLGLLMKAKKITEEYSTEASNAFMSGIKTVGGIAGGAVLGTAAIASRATLGRAGAALANNSAVKNFAAKNAVGDIFQKSMMKLGSSNLDIRGIKVAGKDLSGVTGANFGQGRNGGFTQMREERVAKRLKRAKELEVGEDEPAKQALNHAEHTQHEWTSKFGGEVEGIEKQMENARKNLQDAKNADDGSLASRSKISHFDSQISAFKQQMHALKNGEDVSVEYFDYDPKGELILKNIKKEYSKDESEGGSRIDGKSIHEIETNDIKEAKKKIKELNHNRRNDFANYINSSFSRVTDQITGLGQFSVNGAREAAHKIRMEVAPSGGGAAPKKAAPKPAAPKPAPKPADHGGHGGGHDDGHGDDHGGGHDDGHGGGGHDDGHGGGHH